MPGMAPTDGSPPMLLRRRVSPLGQEALRAAWSLAESATSRIIVSSRHGEFRRTLSILESLAGRTDVSPADFTLSVHHALAGLLSIAQGNRRGHVAVAAGPESFCFAMLEAIACLTEAPHEPVVLVHYDEPLPEPFSIFEDSMKNAEVLALVLTTKGPGVPLSLSINPASRPQVRSSSHAMDFLNFLNSPERLELLSIGERMEWCWRHATAD
jgi:hypothetical protein